MSDQMAQDRALLERARTWASDESDSEIAAADNDLILAALVAEEPTR